MKKLAHQLLLQFALIMVTAATVLAQSTGKIAGKITDSKTGETLIGATVTIQGTTRGSAANVDGRYLLTNVAAGKQTVIVKYIGYQTKSISDIDVKANGTTELNIVMDAATSQALKEVVIKATYKQESTTALYAQQKNNAAITDGITAEAIRRSPDKNTSEVLRRVSGATIQDNKFVVIRGLSDRYNNAQLDGTNLPSTETNRKAFSFDIVPSNLVDNIIISKTATPNLPGDFAGGNVQIITRDIPDENSISLSAGLGYNTNTTFKEFQSGYRNLSDWFAFDDGSRKLPSNFPSTNRITSSTPLSQERNTAALRSLNPNFRVYNQNALMNQSYQLSVNRVKDLKSGGRIGAIVALTYRNNMQTINDLNIDYSYYNFSDQRYRFSTSIGGLANFAYSYGNNKISFKNTYSRSLDDQYLYRTGVSDQTGAPDNHYYAFDLYEKALYKGTLQGDHTLGERKAKLTWTTSYSNITNSQPDQRKVNYALTSDGYLADNTSLNKQNARFFSDLNENVGAGSVDYTLPITMFKEKGTFKAGVASQYRYRTFDPRYIGPVLNTSAPDQTALRSLPLNKIYSRSVISQNVYNLQEITTPRDAYNAYTLTNAGYLMLDNKLSDKLRAVYGLRVEKFDLNLETDDASAGKAILDNIDFLPSANLTYSVTPKANLRLSYSRTVARPELREVAPFGYYDFELLATVSGSTTLKRTQIHNVDFRYEFYPSAGQIISVSAFYKNFKNPIEISIDDQNSTPDFRYSNVQEANNFGVEFELRKTLDFIGQNFKNTTFYTNVSLVKSKVTDPSFAVKGITADNRAMVGQAPYVVNAGLLQTAFSNKFTINALYNRVGPRLFRAPGVRFPGIYENARDVVDLQLGYRIQKNRGEIKLNGSDLLNQNTLFYYKDNTTAYDRNVLGSTISRYKLGSTITLSYAYTFK